MKSARAYKSLADRAVAYAAYPRRWSALRPGGVLMSDDVNDNRSRADFCAEVGIPGTVVPRAQALSGIARKPASDETSTVNFGVKGSG